MEINVIESPLIDGEYVKTDIILSKELEKCYDVEDKKTFKQRNDRLITTAFRLKYNNCHHYTKQWWFPASITIGAAAVLATAGAIAIIKSPKLRRSILPFKSRR